jgi:hypothetical protein
VANWGDCDLGGGAHYFDSNTILVDIYFDYQTVLSTLWHEGYSYYNGCQDLFCHDDTFMDNMWGYCY